MERVPLAELEEVEQRLAALKALVPLMARVGRLLAERVEGQMTIHFLHPFPKSSETILPSKCSKTPEDSRSPT